MAVTEQITRNVSTAAAGATVFPYDFKIIDKADLQVIVDGSIKAVDVDFTVSGVGADSGGDITFLSAMVGGETVTRLRKMAFQRQADYQNLGDLRSATLNNDQDAPILMLQQLAETQSRSLQLVEDAPLGINPKLPVPSPLSVIGWNQFGTSLQNFAPELFVASATAGATYTFAVTAGQTSLATPSIADPWAPQAVFYNGIYQDASAWSWSGGSMTFSEPLPVDGTVTVIAVLTGPGQLNESGLMSYTLPTPGATSRTQREKNADTVSVKDFGAKGDGATDDTLAIQRAIDAMHAGGGGTVSLPHGEYLISASALSETFDNAGAAVPAASCGIVLRKGVHLVGAGVGMTKVSCADRSLFAVAMIAPDGNTVSGFELAGAWNQGDSGAGHGVIVFGTEDGVDRTCRNSTWRDLYIHNFGSYALGLQCGFPTGCHIDNVRTDTTGADAIDLKARVATSGAPDGNSISNCVVRRHGLRVEGSAGVDIRGVWQASNISVLDFGGNASLSYVGIRFRTKEDPLENTWPDAAKRSTLSGFYVRPAQPLVGTGFTGVLSGSDDVHVSNGTVVGCTNGVDITGNANGFANYNTFHGVNAIDSTQYGFRVTTGATGSVISACTTINSTTAGFRNQGTDTRFIACNSVGETTKLSESAGSISSVIIIGSNFGAESGISVSSPAAGRVEVAVRGTSSNIDLLLNAKGSGLVRFGAHTASADAAVSGYITIKDQAGNLRKLAVIS